MRPPPPIFAFRRVATLPANVTGHTVTGLQEGRAYRFRVTPLGVGTDGEPATLDAYTPLRGPTQVTATKTAPWQATLAWQPSPSPLVTGYDVLWSVNGGPFEYYDTVDAGTTGYRFASATAGNIAFAVRASGDGWWDGLGDGYTGGGNTGGGTGFSGDPAGSEPFPAVNPETGNTARLQLLSAAGQHVIYYSMQGESDDFVESFVPDHPFSWSPAPDLAHGWWWEPGVGSKLTVRNLPPHQWIMATASFTNLSTHTREFASGKISVTGRTSQTRASNWPWNPVVTVNAPHTGSSATIEFQPTDGPEVAYKTIFVDVGVVVSTPRVTIDPVGDTHNLNESGAEATFRVSRSGQGELLDVSLAVTLGFRGTTDIDGVKLPYAATEDDFENVPKRVTIPAGASYVDFKVRTKSPRKDSPEFGGVKGFSFQALKTSDYVTDGKQAFGSVKRIGRTAVFDHRRYGDWTLIRFIPGGEFKGSSIGQKGLPVPGLTNIRAIVARQVHDVWKCLDPDGTIQFIPLESGIQMGYVESSKLYDDMLIVRITPQSAIWGRVPWTDKFVRLPLRSPYSFVFSPSSTINWNWKEGPGPDAEDEPPRVGPPPGYRLLG